MRVLVLTNQFANCCGSEVVALEVASWFRERGDRVTLATNVVAEPIGSMVPDGIERTDEVETLPLSAFDLVWCQHDLVTLLPLESLARAAEERALPLVAYVSLSPYEPHESVDPALARALSAEIFANSEETRDGLVSRGYGLFPRDEIRTFHNAAPAAYWSPRADAEEPREGRPRTVAFISNHLPAEMAEAAARLQAEGVAIWRIGIEHDHHLVSPADLHAVDAVATIGKSVVYAIATGTPVYVYDRFGGDGWLTSDGFGANADHNFSGRPRQRRLSPEAIASEIEQGFERAVAEMRRIQALPGLERFRLDHHLEPLRRRALDGGSLAARVDRLRASLGDPFFRAHYEASRSKHQVMRRLYRWQRGL